MNLLVIYINIGKRPVPVKEPTFFLMHNGTINVIAEPDIPLTTRLTGLCTTVK